MKAKIYKPAKSAMQSGDANTRLWQLVFDQDNKTRFTSNLMGWVGNTDPNQQIRLKFETKEAAISYVQKHGIEFEIIEPKQEKLILQSYADNFK